MNRALLMALVLLSTGARADVAPSPDPAATVKAFIADYKAWNDRTMAGRKELDDLRAKKRNAPYFMDHSLPRKEWELQDRALADYEAMLAKYVPPGFEHRGYWADASSEHDPAAEEIVDVRMREARAFVTTHRAPQPPKDEAFAKFFGNKPTVNEYTLTRTADRWHLVSIKSRDGGDDPTADERLAFDPARRRAEDPYRLIHTHLWDAVEPQIEGKTAEFALNFLLRTGHRCRLEPEQDARAYFFPSGRKPAVIFCLRQLTDRYGNNVMAQLWVEVDWPRSASSFSDLFGLLPEGRVKYSHASQEAHLLMPHQRPQRYSDAELPALQKRLARLPEVKALEDRVARDAFEMLMQAGFECGFRDWKAPEGSAPAMFACSTPGPFGLKGCFGFLYFWVEGPEAPAGRPEALFWSTEHRVGRVTPRCGSFNSLSFDE